LISFPYPSISLTRHQTLNSQHNFTCVTILDDQISGPTFRDTTFAYQATPKIAPAKWGLGHCNQASIWTQNHKTLFCTTDLFLIHLRKETGGSKFSSNLHNYHTRLPSQTTPWMQTPPKIAPAQHWGIAVKSSSKFISRHSTLNNRRCFLFLDQKLQIARNLSRKC
jgi:hypothetical protein